MSGNTCGLSMFGSSAWAAVEPHIVKPGSLEDFCYIIYSLIKFDGRWFIDSAPVNLSGGQRREKIISVQLSNYEKKGQIPSFVSLLTLARRQRKKETHIVSP